jgi:hypothetical protein
LLFIHSSLRVSNSTTLSYLPYNRETVDLAPGQAEANSLVRHTDLNEAAGAADATAWA